MDERSRRAVGLAMPVRSEMSASASSLSEREKQSMIMNIFDSDFMSYLADGLERKATAWRPILAYSRGKRIALSAN
jgi:hypothetical protein